MGRQSTYTEEAAAKICEAIAGGETLRAYCRRENTPAWQTVYLWLSTHKDFAERFAIARDVGAEAIAQEALDIADTVQTGTIETDKATKDGRPYTEVRRADMVERAKLRIYTRLQLLAKWNPKKYGDRLDIGNADGEPFKVDSVDHIDAGDAARLVALIAQLRARRDATSEDDGADLV
jgi:hypothetical protein